MKFNNPFSLGAPAHVFVTAAIVCFVIAMVLVKLVIVMHLWQYVIPIILGVAATVVVKYMFFTK